MSKHEEIKDFTKLEYKDSIHTKCGVNQVLNLAGSMTTHLDFNIFLKDSLNVYLNDSVVQKIRLSRYTKNSLLLLYNKEKRFYAGINNGIINIDTTHKNILKFVFVDSKFIFNYEIKDYPTSFIFQKQGQSISVIRNYCAYTFSE